MGGGNELVTDGFMRKGTALVTEVISIRCEEVDGKGWESESASK